MLHQLLKLAVCAILLVMPAPDVFALTDEAEALYKSISGTRLYEESYPSVEPQYLQRLSPPVRIPEIVISGSKTKTFTVFDRAFLRADRRWHLTAIFNRSDDPVNVRLNLDRIWGIGGGTPKLPISGVTENKYLLYDVIDKQILGIHDGSADISIYPNSARLISIQPHRGYPQILSIGDHIGQGLLELKEIRWDDAISTITATTKGINGRSTSIRLYIPQGWKIRSTAINDKGGNWEEYNPEMIRFDVPDASSEVKWRATFDGSVYVKPKPRPVNKSIIAEVIQK